MHLARGLQAAVLALTAVLLVPAISNAQGRATYYYPAPGYYATTRGTVYIPTAGHYFDVPAQSSAAAPAVRPRTISLHRLTITVKPGLPPAARSNVPTYNPTDPW